MAENILGDMEILHQGCRVNLSGEARQTDFIFLYDAQRRVVSYDFRTHGERAAEATKSAGLPEQVLDDLLQAKAYAEARSIQVTVKEPADVEQCKK